MDKREKVESRAMPQRRCRMQPNFAESTPSTVLYAHLPNRVESRHEPASFAAKSQSGPIALAVGPAYCGDKIALFRAPATLDGSDADARLPHRIRWDETRVGDYIIALLTDKLPPNGSEVIRTLQFWDVLEQKDEKTFIVYINNVAGLSIDDGEAVADRIGRLFGKPE